MLSGVILAGGKGARMGGRNKALLKVNGVYLIERQLKVMERLCRDLIIVANDAEAITAAIGRHVRIVPDIYPGSGPLGGMHAAFPLCRQEAVWVVGCDMPFLSGEAAWKLLDVQEREQADAVIPTDGEDVHPLHGVYAKRTRDSLEACLREGRLGVQRWLHTLHTVYVDFAQTGAEAAAGPPFWTNVNTPQDYDAIERIGERTHTDMN